MIKLWTEIGGGLGDIFNRIYGSHQFHVLSGLKEFQLDCLCQCSNPAVRDVMPNIILEDGRLLFDNIIFRPFADNLNNPDLYERTKWRIVEDGYINIDEQEGYDWLFDNSTIKDREAMYDYQYKLGYFENKQLKRINENRYIVVHPSGGLQHTDGLTRDQYYDLIYKLLDKFNNYYFTTIGADTYHKESKFNIKHERFLDLTNKASGCLSAMIVKNASAFIGTHSCWCNMFWHFSKPTVSLIDNNSSWGDGETYIKTNFCNWGFKLKHNRCVIVKSAKQTYEDVINNIYGLLYEVT